MATGRRRDAGRPRGAFIEEAILRAALEDLAAHGVDGVSVDRVAAAAEVNKTTVYRRYPSTRALVAAALDRAVRSTASALTDHGSLRADLLALVAQVAALVGQASGQALVRAALSEEMTVAAAALTAGPLRQDPEEVLQLVRRAVDRGEWDPAHAPDAVVGMLVGGVVHRVMLERRPVTEDWTRTVVDVVTRGVAP